MEKLIELLNEYDKIKGDKEEPIYNWKIAIKTKIYQTYLISARYGFIKWLVENDKIKPLRKFIGWETDEDEPYIQFDLVDQYIAYLSIQDEPIRFLCEILK